MRDKRKYCRPIIEKNPKVGDIIINSAKIEENDTVLDIGAVTLNEKD